MSSKNQFKLIAIGVVALFGLIILFNSWTTIKPGERGFMYKPFVSPSIDPERVYTRIMQ